MTVLSPDIAKQAYRRGYQDAKNGVHITKNPYKPTKSVDSRYDLWCVGWWDAHKGKASQEEAIDYEWLIS